MTDKPHVIDVSTAQFEAEVLQKSLQTPVLVDLWATGCGPCKTLGPILEKLAAAYNGAFILAKIDVDREPQVAAAFQVRSVPSVFLIKDGQVVDGFQGALPESQVRELLLQHGIAPAADAPVKPEDAPMLDPHEEVMHLRKSVEAEPDQAEIKLDLALALLKTGAAAEAEKLLDALPANLATDDRSVRAHARLQFIRLTQDAPAPEVLEAAIASNPDDLRARHLLGALRLVAGRDEQALEQFYEMLRRNRDFEDGLPRKTLIDAFRVIENEDLVGQYRRKMSALLF
ncbi:MAG: co-chaperone YbbN [Xanthomonadaceae bacterium]|jgi:putative thioredoxin|nr:co-chaperone YbbN [Xanthomonadaceae bacterium]